MSQSELPQSWQLPPQDAPTIGGRYRLASKIGEGGMATVYRAWDEENQQWVALKILLPEFARRKKLRKRFANEGETMLKLDHRNIIRVFDVGPEADNPYIAMEIADGGCIIDWVERHGPMPPRLAIDVILQACKGLKAAHEQGVVHRDVKPHNILITRRGRCQLTDFGIAQMDEGNGMTKTGSVMGTLGYMAPEQRTDSKNVDGRADVYGLGATLFKLVTGGTVADLFLAEHDAEMLDGVPGPLVPVLLKATSYKREHRHQTVIELAQDLHGAKQHLPADPEDTPPLPLTHELGEGEPPTLSDLSEPTFADGPDGLHELPLERSRFTPHASASGAPERGKPDEGSLSETPIQLLPYQMPTSQTRNDDPDYIPDYVDRDSLPQARQGYDVELDDETRARVDAAFRKAVEDGRIDEEGNLIEDEVEAEDDRTKGAWDPLEEALGLAQGAILEIISLIMRPLQIAVMVGSILATITGIAVFAWASPVKDAEIEAHKARAEMFQTFDANKGVIQDLAALGADEGTLNSFWFDYEKAADAAKVDVAYKLLHRLEQSQTHARQFGVDLRASKLQMAHERINRIKLAVDHHEATMLHWEQVADGSKGRIAINFGVAHQPDL